MGMAPGDPLREDIESCEFVFGEKCHELAHALLQFGIDARQRLPENVRCRVPLRRNGALVERSRFRIPRQVGIKHIEGKLGTAAFNNCAAR